VEETLQWQSQLSDSAYYSDDNTLLSGETLSLGQMAPSSPSVALDGLEDVDGIDGEDEFFEEEDEDLLPDEPFPSVETPLVNDDCKVQPIDEVDTSEYYHLVYVN